MTLLLEIVGPQAAQLAEAACKLFANAGGTIGRSPDSDWVIPDPFISGRHAQIHYRDGSYLLEDTSSNGVFVNSRENRLDKDQLYALRTGDRVFIDDYEIKVTIVHPQAEQFDPRATQAYPQAQPADSRAAKVRPQAEHGFTARLGAVVKSAGPGSGRDPLLTLPLEDPAGAVVDALIPEDYEPIFQMSASNVPEVPSMSAAAPPSKPAATSAGVDFTSLLLAAGIPQAQITPELSENLGRVLWVAVEGLLDVLRSRERIKDEFGMRMTTFKPIDNNPLKFSANVEDALHNLFVKHNAAYLEPVAAFEDAFREVRHYQMAMLGAVKVVFRDMLATFDPVRLQQEFDRQSKTSSLFAMGAKTRYWELYREKFRTLAGGADAGLRAAFGDKFADAYEQQLAQLKAASAQSESRRK
jgi:type VI secretion system FHA domain protein